MTAARARFTLTPRGPFSLEPVRRLQCGFLLGPRTCDASSVTLAFPSDHTFAPIAVRLRAEDEGHTVGVELFGTNDVAHVRPQLERMLALDEDSGPYFQLLARHPVLSKLRPFRPVVAPSPYAMAGWLVLSQRMQIQQAARVQARLSEATGDTVRVEDAEALSFPRPESLLRLHSFQGVSSEKWRRLQSVARAALEGKLDAARLRRLPYATAREELLSLHGIGPWSADGILVRGAGLTDALPLTERTLHGAVQAAYQLPTLPSDAEVTELAEAWRPFRTWVSVLLIASDFEGARFRARAAPVDAPHPARRRSRYFESASR